MFCWAPGSDNSKGGEFKAVDGKVEAGEEFRRKCYILLDVMS